MRELSASESIPPMPDRIAKVAPALPLAPHLFMSHTPGLKLDLCGDSWIPLTDLALVVVFRIP